MLAGTSNCGHCIMLTRCIDSVFLPQLGEHRVGHPLVMIMVCVCVCHIIMGRNEEHVWTHTKRQYMQSDTFSE